MTAFKPFPELTVEDGNDDGLYSIQRLNGAVVIAGHFASRSIAERLADCWNACRKLYSPAAHIGATEDYVKRLEQLRKDALAMGGGATSAGWSFDISAAPRDCRLWLATKCGKVSATYWDKKREQWSGLADKEQPIAWQPYIVPEFPRLSPTDAGALHVTQMAHAAADNLPIIDDVGSM